MGNFTGCTNWLIKQSIFIRDIYSTLKLSIELYHFTSSSNLESYMDLAETDYSFGLKEGAFLPCSEFTHQVLLSRFNWR